LGCLISKINFLKNKKGISNHISENLRLKDIVIELNQRISEIENVKRKLSKDNLQLETENSSLRKEVMKITTEKDN
jgi:hypothetical protein